MTFIDSGLLARLAVPPLPLDTFTPAAAYSTRHLRNGYNAAALRVRRSSDNAEQDIGFAGNILDVTSLTAFCGAGDGFVSAWYDQSGNGNTADQATAADQPKIVSSGSVLTMGGRPTLTFDTTDYLSVTTSATIDLLAAMTIHAVVSVPDLAQARWVVTKGVSNGANTNTYEWSVEATTGTWLFNQANGTTYSYVPSTTAATAATKMGIAVTRVDGSSTATITHYRDGSAAGSSAIAVSPSTTSNPMLIGTRADRPNYFNGSMGELILFSTALTAPNLSAIYSGF